MEEWEEGAAETLERLTGSKMADAHRGTIRIVSRSEPRGWSRYQTCAMEVILEAPDLPAEPLSTEVVFDKRHWPAAGTVLPARISRRQPRLFEVNWEVLPRV